MITLRKRISVYDRVGKVIVIDLKNESEPSKANEYICNVFGKDRCAYIYEQANQGNTYWLVIDEYHADYWLYNSYEDVLEFYKSFAMFGKDDRSSFKYWFAHWCGFQLTALNLGIWKFKYLFHDIEKPWLKLIWRGNYKKVQKWHRCHNNHHLEYGVIHSMNDIDWEALMIDWECCGLSKQQAQLDARETMEYELAKDKWKPYEHLIRSYLEPLLDKYNL